MGSYCRTAKFVSRSVTCDDESVRASGPPRSAVRKEREETPCDSPADLDDDGDVDLADLVAFQAAFTGVR